MRITAKFNSFCGKCRADLFKGTTIEWRKGEKPLCLGCASENKREWKAKAQKELLASVPMGTGEEYDKARDLGCGWR